MITVLGSTISCKKIVFYTVYVSFSFEKYTIQFRHPQHVTGNIYWCNLQSWLSRDTKRARTSMSYFVTFSTNKTQIKTHKAPA